MKQEYYWHLELYSGEIIKVKPVQNTIKTIQLKIGKQEGAITSKTRSIPTKDVKDFRVSDEPYIDQELLESGLQAFDEPLVIEGSIAARWVKKTVPLRRWDQYYRQIPAYRLLEQNDNYATIAFLMPVHEIDNTRVHPVTAVEEMRIR